MFVWLTGCSVIREFQKSEEIAKQNEASIEDLHKEQKLTYNHRKEVEIKKGQYIGSGKIPLSWIDQLPAVFQEEITFLDSGESLEAIANKITTISGILIEAPLMAVEASKSSNPSTIIATKSDTDLDMDTPPLKEGPPLNRPIQLSYKGTLKGLLDNVANFYGVSWEYKPGANLVSFYAYKTKTYTIFASPGDLSVESAITNRNSTAGKSDASDTQIEGIQETTSKIKFTVYEEILKNIRAMAPTGRVYMSKTAGSITITATPSDLLVVDDYIEQLNIKLSRQVVVAVKVYSLELNSENALGFDLNVAFESLQDEISVVTTAANPFTISSAAGNLTAMIVDSPSSSNLEKFIDSEAIVKALKKHGNVSLVTSGSGITLNNQPLPIQIVQRTGYLASVGVPDTEFQTITELTPGQVTTGFSMLATPHILDSTQVILRYSLSLSSLDDLKTIVSGEQSIQTPEVSTRAFMQTAKMKLGSTLLMAGFEETKDELKKGNSITSFSKMGSRSKSIFIISITVNKV